MTRFLRPKKAFNLIILFLLTGSAYAQTVLTISGNVAKPLTLQAADLKSMPHAMVTGTDKDGKEHQYSGVPLVDLLKLAGATLGGELRGGNLTKYAVVKAVDGYEVLFALPEIDPEFATRTILLADSVDGSPLPKGVGPYRVIVPGEKKPARWIREVKAIEIKSSR
ncbi:molybdopterin-dependent oxidoreductase [Spirosoma agri]|uniref:Molybdopterin-dependent oxidoreductase n=1 Tax=Spirosoma agri TaxID=1987381 RepID=A0A6M0IKN3_9BACT|nr:molybdopterin-dependent oxidoreductase [Spirosoma agri]NEU68392.1 molybdopterin-dependent oxidoreductase [Spirosoma agri]